MYIPICTCRWNAERSSKTPMTGRFTVHSHVPGQRNNNGRMAGPGAEPLNDAWIQLIF